MKLINDGKNVWDDSGKFMFSMPLTQREIEISNCIDRRKDESWLDYRNRTKEERKIEEAKNVELAKKIVTAFNEKYGV